MMESCRTTPARYEIKMTCDEMYLPEARAWLQLHPATFVQAYPPRQVNNLYFDTHEATCLNDHLAGAADRKKLRLRWYGKTDSAVQGTLELKTKSNQLGWKICCLIPLTLDLATISWHDLARQLRAHAAGPVAVWLSHADRPTLLNRYMRAYYETVDRQIRITLDHDLRVYDQIAAPSPNLTFTTPVASRAVMEVKSDPAFHRRVSDILSSFPFPVERHSKYVSGLLGSSYF